MKWRGSMRGRCEVGRVHEGEVRSGEDLCGQFYPREVSP